MITVGAATAYTTTIRFSSICIVEPKLLNSISNVQSLDVFVIQGASWRWEHYRVCSSDSNRDRPETGVAAFTRVWMRGRRMTHLAVRILTLYVAKAMFDCEMQHWTLTIGELSY